MDIQPEQNNTAENLNSAPFAEKPKNKKFVAFLFAGLVLVIGGIGATWRYFSQQEQAACTMEAKQCPDGSYVGRTGENCEFAACPEPTADWQAFRDENLGIEFKYPGNYDVSQQIVGYYPPCMENCDANYKYFAELGSGNLIMVQSKENPDDRISLRGPLVLKSGENWLTIFDSKNELTEKIVAENKVFYKELEPFFITNSAENKIIQTGWSSKSNNDSMRNILILLLSHFKFTK